MKCFYLLSFNDKSDIISVICDLDKMYPSSSCMKETTFSNYLKFPNRLYSVDAMSSEVFQTILTKHHIQFERLDLNEQYERWLKSCANVKLFSHDKNDADSEIIIICEESITEKDETVGGRKILTEAKICEKDKLIIYVNSREHSCHNAPHVHVSYKGKKGYLVISLVDFHVMEPLKYDNRVYKKAICLLKEGDNIKKAKEAWNASDSIIRIPVED